MIFIKKFQIKKIHFILFQLIFLSYYCSINLKRQSEHSGLRPDPSSVVFSFKFNSNAHFCNHLIDQTFKIINDVELRKKNFATISN